MRLIDKEELLRWLRKYQDTHQLSWTGVMTDIIGYVQDTPAYDWIDAEQAKPPYGEEVLVMVDTRYDGSCCYIGGWLGDQWGVVNHHPADPLKVIKWMPIPPERDKMRR